jgi:hypothetical protein
MSEPSAKPRRAVISREPTSVELQQRRFDTVDLVIQGFSLRQIGEHHGLNVSDVRRDYLIGMETLRDHSIEATKALRDEVTARQRLLIASNMAKARAGDVRAATIVQRADEMLVSIWGLRSLRVEIPDPEPDPDIAVALEAYLTGITEKKK